MEKTVRVANGILTLVTFLANLLGAALAIVELLG